MPKDGLTIGDVAARTGLAPSAIRHYESQGLVFPSRNDAGQRRYARADIRRLSFVLIAQQLGFSLSRIKDQLAALPDNRAPTKRDWQRISSRFGRDLDARIAQMTRLRDRLDGCIGCGCLSLESCHLYNPEDRAARQGTGPRLVIDKALDD
ncbi:redox-sensitive transcriptional activator SoxR [Tropicibacter oceani]|uniref:Redox-sensitive transcriptional activator SoxR n=1 Tax=Tropicibacter oceani TaxID=3058420 RepID=A0ABY8QGW6_9RHOB|nr:redox-sensitive transcriptional activator SoxR [Tropicibacter oceani]WGW03231.1 redox-sensitive transcriptional activator SoxR [Tropicibacter oceani]